MFYKNIPKDKCTVEFEPTSVIPSPLLSDLRSPSPSLFPLAQISLLSLIPSRILSTHLNPHHRSSALNCPSDWPKSPVVQSGRLLKPSNRPPLLPANHKVPRPPSPILPRVARGLRTGMPWNGKQLKMLKIGKNQMEMLLPMLSLGIYMLTRVMM